MLDSVLPENNIELSSKTGQLCNHLSVIVIALTAKQR